MLDAAFPTVRVSENDFGDPKSRCRAPRLVIPERAGSRQARPDEPYDLLHAAVAQGCDRAGRKILIPVSEDRIDSCESATVRVSATSGS